MENIQYSGAEYSSQQLFRELKEKVEEEGIEDFDAYRDMVRGLIEEKRGYGFFRDEEDLVQIERDLESRWKFLVK
ncbi:MAG TPA: hypothetical protein PKA31_00205 [Candidatus Moranbacteria bacterium]|nr:hypothetical protein [Candidatus Moranbacteria bacterium]